MLLDFKGNIYGVAEVYLGLILDSGIGLVMGWISSAIGLVLSHRPGNLAADPYLYCDLCCMR